MDAAALSLLLLMFAYCGRKEITQDGPRGERQDSYTVDRVNEQTGAKERASAAAVFEDDAPFQVVLEAHVPHLKLKPLAEELLAAEWGVGTLLHEYFARQNVTELRPSPWIDAIVGSEPELGVEAVSQIRKASMQAPVPPAPFCPQSTRMTATYRISTTPISNDCSIRIESSCVSHDVPFGENFCVQERTELVPDDSGSGVTIRKSCRVLFLRGVGLLKGAIQAAAAARQTESGEAFLALLRERASKMRAASENAAGTFDMTVFDATVFELERRPTIFHNKWRPPFLPHDGMKRRRWVDLCYDKHPWSQEMRREDSALAEKPPLEPGPGWKPLSEWMVSTNSATDADGWQYAVDFYQNDRLWGPDSGGRSVRRRLWKRKFLTAKSDSKL